MLRLVERSLLQVARSLASGYVMENVVELCVAHRASVRGKDDGIGIAHIMASRLKRQTG